LLAGDLLVGSLESPEFLDGLEVFEVFEVLGVLGV
jgi:hypothetical protein